MFSSYIRRISSISLHSSTQPVDLLSDYLKKILQYTQTHYLFYITGCRLLLLTSLIGVVLFTVVNSQTTSTSPLEMASTDQEAQLLKGNSLFTTALYQELAKSGENLIFSPISVHAVLSMAFQGAEGETKDAFISTLRVTDTKTAADGYNSIMSRLNNIPNITLHIANKVYLKDGFSLKNSFKDAVVKSFLSEVEPIDFAQPAAAPTINTWVSNKTNDKIKELISANDLDSETRLVLLNAIYFKGNWAYKFDARNTLEEDFYINNDETVKVNMMHIKKRFNYKEDTDLDAKILEMPYENRDVSMVIILPNERTGLANLEKKLANVDLSSITNGSSNVEVQVSLPRFKIESTIDLKETLTNVSFY